MQKETPNYFEVFINSFFNVEFIEVKELANRLTRVGNPNTKLLFSDFFKLFNVMELYCRKDWAHEDKFVAISNYLEYGDNNYRNSSLFAIPINQDTHLKFRKSISTVNIDQLKLHYQMAKYKDLIQEHIRKMDLVKLEMAILGSIAAFNSEEKEAAQIIIEEYLQISKNIGFWQQRCDIILSEICTKFRKLLSQKNYEPDDKIQFNMFQLLTIYFASMALQSKALRKQMGIRKSFFYR